MNFYFSNVFVHYVYVMLDCPDILRYYLSVDVYFVQIGIKLFGKSDGPNRRGVK